MLNFKYIFLFISFSVGLFILYSLQNKQIFFVENKEVIEKSDIKLDINIEKNSNDNLLVIGEDNIGIIEDNENEVEIDFNSPLSDKDE